MLNRRPIFFQVAVGQGQQGVDRSVSVSTEVLGQQFDRIPVLSVFDMLDSFYDYRRLNIATQYPPPLRRLNADQSF